MRMKTPGRGRRPGRRGPARREPEEHYRFLFEGNPHPMWVYDIETLVFLAVNEAAISCYGYTRDEFLAMTIKDIRPPEDVPALLRNVARATEGLDHAGVWRHRKKDGSVIEVEVTSHTLDFAGRPARLILAQDVTARRRAEEALRESEKRYRMLFDLESDAIFMVDNESGRLLEANTGAAALYGYTREELLALKNTDLSAEPEDTRRVTTETAIAADQIVRVPLRFHRRKDGTVFPVEITGRFFEWGGRSVHIAAIRDITDRKRAAEEHRRLEEKMRQVQKLQSLGVLAGGIAHDFNNLLTAIQGNADLALLSLPPTAPARQHVKEIEGAVRRAAELCRQMLAYAGKGRLVVQRHDLSVVVGEMSSILDASISKKAVLRYRLAPVLPAIEADATQLRQVIMNLITNASEALGEASGIVSVSTGVMQCDRAYLEESTLGQELPEGPYVYLEVADTGCGMDAETQQRIFDPFFTTKFTGRGLGLAAVLGIVRGHRGAIRVYSKPGQGSTLTILFPMAHGEPVPADVAPEAPTTWRGSGTVLLVDDEEPVRNVAKEMLERLGFRVVTAADGRQALATFRVHANRIVCVLLDLTMPRMNGVETFQELRSLRADLRVILSSGYDEQDVIQRFAGRGLAGFIQKPYTLGALQEVLRRALG